MVGALLAVAHKEVLGVAVGVRQLNHLELRHVVDRRSLGRLVRGAARVDAVVGLLLVHHHAPSPVADSRIAQREGAIDVGALHRGQVDGRIRPGAQ